MSYYMRLEDADGNLIVGTEIDHEGSSETVAHWIDKLSGEFIGTVKLYDLGNPTQTIEVDNVGDEDRGADGESQGDPTDGAIRAHERRTSDG